MSRMEISRSFSFEAAHRLPNVPADHKCARLHGHSFRVTLTVTGPVDEQLGWVCDFAEIDAAWKPLHAILDHNYLNEVEGLENPTSEILARYIADRVNIDGATLVSVRVHETCRAGCVLFI